MPADSAKGSKQWVMPTGDYATCAIPLSSRSRPKTSASYSSRQFSTGVLRGHEGAPLVIGDVAYLHTPFPNNVRARPEGPDPPRSSGNMSPSRIRPSFR
jgi:hypothetical protein